MVAVLRKGDFAWPAMPVHLVSSPNSTSRSSVVGVSEQYGRYKDPSFTTYT